MASNREKAKELDKAYQKMRKKNMNKPVPQIDEKGLYLTLLYDFKAGRLSDKHRVEKFKELGAKYGKK